MRRFHQQPVGNYRARIDGRQDATVATPDGNDISRPTERERDAASAVRKPAEGGHSHRRRIEPEKRRPSGGLGKLLAEPERSACADGGPGEVEADFVQRHGHRRPAHGPASKETPPGRVGNAHASPVPSAMSSGNGAP